MKALGAASGIAKIIIILIIGFFAISYITNQNNQNKETGQSPYNPSYPSNPPTPSHSTSQAPSPVLSSSYITPGFGSATVHYSVRNNGGDGWVTYSIDCTVRWSDSQGLTRTSVKTGFDNFHIGSGQTIDRSYTFSLSTGETAVSYDIDRSS